MHRISNAQLQEKYGTSRPARYFVRTPVDLADVAETVFRQIGYYSTTRETPHIMRISKCTAMPVPNTLSSMILAIHLPERILTGAAVRNPEPRVSEIEAQLTDAPILAHSSGATCISKRIADFFDLYAFHWHVRRMLQTTTEGTRLWTAKRSASLRVTSAEALEYIELSISIPGIFFANPASLALSDQPARP